MNRLKNAISAEKSTLCNLKSIIKQKEAEIASQELVSGDLKAEIGTLTQTVQKMQIQITSHTRDLRLLDFLKDNIKTIHKSLKTSYQDYSNFDLDFSYNCKNALDDLRKIVPKLQNKNRTR